MLFKFHKYLYIICLLQPWAPCVTDGIVYHNLQFVSPNEIFIPNIIPSCLASLTASWFTSQVLWAIRMAIISVCWVNFQTSLIFVCGYQWMYIVDQLIIDKVLFTFQQMFLHLLDYSNVSRLKNAKGIYAYQSIQYHQYKFYIGKHQVLQFKKKSCWNRNPECNLYMW